MENGDRVVAQAQQRFGGLDVVVANAAYELRGDILETALDDWDAHHAVLLRGAYATFKSALPLMIPQRSGSLIAVASQLAFVGQNGSHRMFPPRLACLVLCDRSRWIARHGIRANALCPGPTLTPLLERQLTDLIEMKSCQLGLAATLNGLGKPKEIANGGLFLASDESAFMTGGFPGN